MSHRIRLRKPWQRDEHTVRPYDEGVHADASGRLATTTLRVDVPDQEPIESGTGTADANHVLRVIYRRQFHRPSGIERGEQVLLEVGEVHGNLVGIRLNAFTIDGIIDSGTSEPIERFTSNRHVPRRWNLEERLADHNELEIELESTSAATGPPRLIGEVNLWIVPSN